MRLSTTTQFKADLKRAKRRGKDISKLRAVVNRLLSAQALDPRQRLHRLSGRWSGYWECHVESDWLLIWEIRDGHTLILIRTGRHVDLFR